MSARTKMEAMREDRDDWRDTARQHARRIEALEAKLLAADQLYGATSFLADNDPYDVVCDSGGTAILVGLSGIRHALTAYRSATGGET